MPKASLKASSKTTATPQTQADPSATIAQRIKLLRDRLSLRAVELDRLTGLGVGTVGRLERGDQRIYASHLFRIAQCTGVDVGWFYRDEDAAPDTINPQELESVRLLEAYMRIEDPALKRDMFELIETLAEEAKG